MRLRVHSKMELLLSSVHGRVDPRDEGGERIRIPQSNRLGFAFPPEYTEMGSSVAASYVNIRISSSNKSIDA